MNHITAILLSVVFALQPLPAENRAYSPAAGLKEMAASWLHRREITSTKYVGKPSDERFTQKEFTLDDVVTVKKEKGKDFVILNLTDNHFSDYDYRFFTGFEATATARRLVQEVKPDLITVTGDMVCGSSTRNAIERFTDMMESFNVPWAPVFGNHDDEANCDLNYLADVMTAAPHCLMRKGDPAMGVGNYIVAVTEENGEKTEIKEALLMMDSHHSQPNNTQQEWVKWATAGINRLSNNGADISVWMHIPLPDYELAYNELYNESTGQWEAGCRGYGEKHEAVCCEYNKDGTPMQRGFLQILQNAGTVRNVICGHEHMNNFSVEYKGIRLTYTMKLGFASGYQLGFNGGTVIKVNENGIYRITHLTKKCGKLVTLADIPVTR